MKSLKYLAAYALILGSVTLSAYLATAKVTEAGIFDSIATKDWVTKDSKKFKVDAYGYDIRVYEWVTESNPNVVCTVAIGNSDSSPYMGMQCFQAKTKKTLD